MGLDVNPKMYTYKCYSEILKFGAVCFTIHSKCNSVL